jgi:DNA polymerase IV (archaeal DinB-like DNA polymerase)
MLSLNPHANSNERQIILHVDMDSFFASVEVREKPELAGLDPKRGKGRGVVCTCSYEAREYGIHSAMPMSQAYKLCPDAAFLPVNIRLYVQVSDNIMEIMKGIDRRNPKYHFTDSKC